MLIRCDEMYIHASIHKGNLLPATSCPCVISKSCHVVCSQPFYSGNMLQAISISYGSLKITEGSCTYDNYIHNTHHKPTIAL